MIWQFTKMHGAGNDFVVLDGVRQAIDMTPARARALADRHFGVGADQILLVERPTVADADFRYRIFNADGGEVEHCGNGARCFVRFVHEQGLSGRNPLRAQIPTGVIVLDEGEDGEVTVEMGVPRFDPADVPFDPAGLESRREGNETLWRMDFEAAAFGQPANRHDVLLSVVNLSNPHAVQVVEDVDAAPVPVLGPLIESHARFARRVNAGFMQVVDRHTVRLRVYERGAGETLACGSGACAAVAAGIRRGLLESPVDVHTRGGRLTIAWDGGQIRMTGPAVTVYQGSIDIEALTP